jgi:tartrate dehydrogenase/decarboxylase/D-malate dehydrogenase
MSRYEIAVIPGDGVGKEVVPAALEVLDAVTRRFSIDLDYSEFDWSCETYMASGRMMPEDGLDRLSRFDAILLGAVGYPGVPDHVSLWGLLIPIRRAFEQYVNLRPVRMLPGVRSPLADPRDIDIWVVRENSEGEYSQIGGMVDEDTPNERVEQVSVFTRKGVDRIIDYAFRFAHTIDRPHVTSATKSNGIFHSMPYWDARFEEAAGRYPDVRTDRFHIDILCARFVLTPRYFDVVVASNLFGDILSDLGPGVTGTIAVAPSANINPERDHPSMFEPVHGSAPDIAGQGIADPIGQIWAAAMMLDHLGEARAAAAVLGSIEEVLSDPAGPRTPDLGGRSSTSTMGLAVAQAVAEEWESGPD